MVSENERLFIKDIFKVIWRRMWLIVLTVFIFTGAAVGFSFTQKPIYEASVRLLIGQKQVDSSQQLGNLAGSVVGLQQLTTTMVEAINSRSVAKDVVQQLGLQESPEALLNNITVSQVGTTQFIEVTYTDTDPERARDVANTIGDVSSRRIAKASASPNNITVSVWDRAIVPNSPVRPKLTQNGLLGLGLGIMFGIGLVFLLEFLDDSWRSPEEVERVTGVPNFGVIPEFKTVKGK